MARKSRDLRLSQTKDLIAKYEAAGLGNDKVCRFMRDMEYRLERNKGLSTGRRNWLDRLIDEGVPEAKNPERVEEILAAANLEGMQEKKSVLEDFAGKVRKGWSLSEKQESWLSKMLAEAQDIRDNGVWHPSDDLKSDLEVCLRLAKTKNGWFWSHKPGSAKAYSKVESYMDGSSTRVDEWACTKFINTFKTTMKELKTPKHAVGSMCFIGHSNEVAVIADAPFVTEHGKLVYPIIVSGSMRDESAGNIYKRRR